ncbi:MAG TPA: hypothetical protein VHP11_16245 [Tepidisphaeraceae bacterium]|nr:hypothetical protein [Tepidisphaeraceae bacterium]
MKKKHPPTPRKSLTPPPRRPIRLPGILLLLALSSLLAMSVLYLFTNIGSATHPQAAAQQPTTRPSSTLSEAECQRLAGRWVRPDGGYVLHIKTVDHNGNLDAAYFNPRSINIHKALASRDGPSIKLLIELRDVNYPGCTYTLTYDPQADRFTGIYYQALLRQRFQIAFSRTQ